MSIDLAPVQDMEIVEVKNPYMEELEKTMFNAKKHADEQNGYNSFRWTVNNQMDGYYSVTLYIPKSKDKPYEGEEKQFIDILGLKEPFKEDENDYNKYKENVLFRKEGDNFVVVQETPEPIEA